MKMLGNSLKITKHSEYPVKDGGNHSSGGTRMKNPVVPWNSAWGKKLCGDARMAQTCLPRG